MPSMKAWIDALTTPRTVTIDSSGLLAANVTAIKKSKSFKGVPKTVTGMATFATPREIQVRPAFLLESLSRTTTPRVRNLVDLTSVWAWIRYPWAFDPDLFNRNLRLSSHSTGLDFHQKAVLSDDMDVGIAAHITRHFLGGSRPVPVSLALRKYLSSGIQQAYSTSPDYIFDAPTGGYIVVECKGK